MPTMRTGHDYRSNDKFNRMREYSYGVVDRRNSNFYATPGSIFRHISRDDAFRGGVPNPNPAKYSSQKYNYQTARRYKNDNVGYSRRSRSVPSRVSDKYREIDREEICERLSRLDHDNYWIYQCLKRKYSPYTQTQLNTGWRR